MTRLGPLAGLLAVLAAIAACSQSVKPAAAPATAPAPAPASAGVTTASTSPTTVSPSPVVPVQSAPSTPAAAATPTLASIERTICAAVFPHGAGNGLHCAVTNGAVSTVDPVWVHGAIGLYNGQNQPASDIDAVIYNLRTHRLIGPTNVGFCGQGGGTVLVGYSAVPTTVLTGFGLRPCAAPPTAAGSTGTGTGTGTATLKNMVGTWRQHEAILVINSAGTANLKYADLTACPTCSFATAPVGTVTFVLKAVTGKLAKGTVTASSDAKVYKVGQPIVATLTAGSPGQILRLDYGGRTTLLCNQTSAGQCGA